jgi:hypothetical protein
MPVPSLGRALAGGSCTEMSTRSVCDPSDDLQVVSGLGPGPMMSPCVRPLGAVLGAKYAKGGK